MQLFLKINFTHIHSEINQDKATNKSVVNSHTILSGLTEWASNTTPELSITGNPNRLGR
jgi:hypothetical protein